MQHKTKIWVCVVVVLSIFPLYLVGSCVAIVFDISRRDIQGHVVLSKINPQQLLADCRNVMSNIDQYRNGTSHVSNDSSQAVGLAAIRGEIGTNMPVSIRNLNPDYILIRTNQIRICLTSPIRTKIVGFPEGVEGWGKEKLASGLWRWGP
jgi:hypothetical protein